MKHHSVRTSWPAIASVVFCVLACAIQGNESLRLQDLIISQRQQHHKQRRSVFHGRWNPQEKVVIASPENPAVKSTKAAHPWLKLTMTTNLMFNPHLYMCHEYGDVLCHNKTESFKQRVLGIFEKSLEETTNASNAYNVHINLTTTASIATANSSDEDFDEILSNISSSSSNSNSNESISSQQTACLLLDADVRVLKRRDAPFSRLALGKLFPKQSLLPNAEKIKTCAIVSSAGSLAGSKLGEFIDSHDVIMRFNNAPTEGHELDAGSKTTIRVLNSQVVSKPEFNFTHSPMFQNITIAAWDPSKYNNSLNDWFDSYDHNLFQNYEIYRQRYPKSRAFLIDPRSVWRLWRNLQIFTRNHTILTNPPSSGFIGLALLLPFCPIVDFIEYIPSTRLSGRCHYYTREINPTCTFGAWHPLAAEKLMALDMNAADDWSVFQYGNLRINQPDRNLCAFNSKDY